MFKKMQGGLEKVDVGAGHLIIRHPETQELRIVHVSPEDAKLIHDWHELRKKDRRGAPLIQHALGHLSEDIRQQILDGYTPKEFDEAFKDENENEED